MKKTEKLSTSKTLEVAIVGAGFGGIGMGVSLLKAGIKNFTIFEKGPEVGGIWQWNTYPGCGCDVPNQLYSFSFAKYRNSSIRYPDQPDILSYLKNVADDFGIRSHLRLSTTIKSAVWDDKKQVWIVTTESGEVHTAKVAIFAVGQLHRPFTPQINGHKSFNGPAFHTAQWDHSVDLAGKNVAVIGSGSSAAQLIPHVARVAKKLDVYQRTPNWVLPKPGPHFGKTTSWLFNRVPALQTVFRGLVWLGADIGLTPVISRGWSARPIEWIARWHLKRQIPDPKLRKKLIPTYTIGCKRIVIDSNFYPALNRKNVEVITDPIKNILASSVKTQDGKRRATDVIVYATGFKTTEFLVPIDIQGRNGVSLHKRWQAGAEAFMGLALPEFPNMFMLHGPNTILGHNSNVFIIEQQVHYVMKCLKLLTNQEKPFSHPIELTDKAMTEYKQWLENKVGGTVWLENCKSWYKTPDGRVVNPWPESTRYYRRMARRNPGEVFRPIN